jgi:translation initiation factor 4A
MELAFGVKGVVSRLGKFFDNIKIHVLVGGVNMRDQIKMLRDDGTQIIIGTPVRVSDLIQRKCLNLNNLKCFILDNTEDLLDESRGYKGEIHSILQHVPETSQCCSFSYMMSRNVSEMISSFIKDPNVIKIVEQHPRLHLYDIKQYYIQVGLESEKKETLTCLLENMRNINYLPQLLIYCNTVRKVDWLKDQLVAEDFVVSTATGSGNFMEMNTVIADKEQLEEFYSGKSRILIVTDQVTHLIRERFRAMSNIDHPSMNAMISDLIFNYDLPLSPEIYMNRCGSYGYYGNRSKTVSFILEKEIKFKESYEQYCNTQIEDMPTPITRSFVEGSGSGEVIGDDK